MALTEKLTNIADAIRAKTGESDSLTLDEMATAIEGISGGGSGEPYFTDEQLIFQGQLPVLDTNGLMKPIIEKEKSRVQFKNINSNIQNGISGNWGDVLSGIKIELGKYGATTCSLYTPFSFTFRATSYPKFTGPEDTSKRGCSTFQQIMPYYITEEQALEMWEDLCNVLPDNVTTENAETITTSNPNYYFMATHIFQYCQTIRYIPELLENTFFMANYPSNSNWPYYAGYSSRYSSCYMLDHVTVPVVINRAMTSNGFTSTFNYCLLLKSLKFATNSDGTPKVAPWKSQTIDLAYSIGYDQGNWTSSLVREGYLSNDKKVTNATTYQALKDDPDWFTLNMAYSKYNHDSAVETINSLPDTSAYLAENGGTNTIKFNGTSGSATDAGAINTLTAEEIAVATAKGWTVTLV